MKFNDYLQEKALHSYLAKKTPVVTDYQYIDDYVKDSMAHRRLIAQISKQPLHWLDARYYRLNYVGIAEACGLKWKDKAFELEIIKERENNGD